MKKINYKNNCMGKLWNFFRFSLVSLAMLLPILSAKATTDETKLSLSLKNANLPTILKEIKNQTISCITPRRSILTKRFP